MVYLSNFDTDFKGRQFKTSTSTEYTAVGYGDNPGNPYLIGLHKDASNRVTLKTILFKDAEFLPLTNPSVAATV